jgi:hypothetical protein
MEPRVGFEPTEAREWNCWLTPKRPRPCLLHGSRRPLAPQASVLESVRANCLATSSLGSWHSRPGSFSLPVSEDHLVFVLLENPFVQRVHR